MSRKNVLIIGDTQFPYERPDYLKFCKKVAEKYKCGRIVHIGDVADCLNFSNYERNPATPSVLEEVMCLQDTFAKWEDVFPKVECVVGNHDNRVRRKLDTAGFAEELLSLETIYREVFGFPKKWTMLDKLVVDTPQGPVYCLHGDERGSSVVAGATARKLGASLIRGHHHSRSFVYHVSTPHQLIFDMIVGCGIDDQSIAFKYNKKDLDRPIYSVGILIDGVPQVIPMPINKGGTWNGKL